MNPFLREPSSQTKPLEFNWNPFRELQSTQTLCFRDVMDISLALQQHKPWTAPQVNTNIMSSPFLDSPPATQLPDLDSYFITDGSNYFSEFLETSTPFSDFSSQMITRNSSTATNRPVFTVIREPRRQVENLQNEIVNQTPVLIDQEDDTSDTPKKKYKTYKNVEKHEILKYCEEHGFEKTLEKYQVQNGRISKKKLNLWMKNKDKVKNIIGKKSTDPVRDEALTKWYMDFKATNERPPNRRELKSKALELSGNPNFQGSKGWLDKFCKRVKIEVLPIRRPNSQKIAKSVSRPATQSQQDDLTEIPQAFEESQPENWENFILSMDSESPSEFENNMQQNIPSFSDFETGYFYH